MATISRPEQVSAAFLRLTTTLTTRYDVLELLHILVEESVRLLEVTQAGLLLADPHGDLQVLASTSEESRLVEVLQLQAGEGPCIDCYRTGTVVTIDDISTLGSRWPVFQKTASDQGFLSVHAVPLRIHNRTIGAMGLFSANRGALTQEDAAIGQALADVATISLIHERTLRESKIINDQLQRALNSRIAIEQAKGVISHTASVDMGEAFARLRNYSRSHNQSLHDTAAQVISRALDL
jgi:transcriptional regulator with GAF, ATPase, and Fis domain